MKVPKLILNVLVAAVMCGIPVVAGAQTTVNELLDRLADPELRNWEVVEEEIYMRWSLSGSPSADYLLRRGREALAAEDFAAAYDHLTALTDHAPDFAEGWNARATLLFEMEDYGPAIADLQRVLYLEPRHFGALTGLGLMLQDMGELERAREVFEMAHAIHPNQPDIDMLLQDIEQMLDGEAL